MPLSSSALLSRPSVFSFARPALLSLCGLAALALTGCGLGTTAAPDPVSLAVNGRVHGGQQPVVGAQLQLFVVGNAGNGSASTAKLDRTVLSDSQGGFSITGDYTCSASTDQVFLVATGGNPGLGPNGRNPALAMMAALGNCGDLSPTQFIVINEITTVAAAWALAPFATGYDHIGASSTNATGIANAMRNAALIANTATGNTATLPSTLSTEPGKIAALADAMASCINSDGGTGCTPFFSAATSSGVSAPSNTFDAALNIIKHPGTNVAAVFSAIAPQPPFPTALTQAPHDWTLSLTVTGGGLLGPTALGLDAQGNAWVADVNLLSGFSPQGTPLSPTGFGSGSLGTDWGLTVDPRGDIWVSVSETPSHRPTKGSIVRLLGASSGGALGTPTVFVDNSINYPFAIAADSNGKILIANNSIVSGTAGTGVVVLDPTANTFTPLTGGNAIEGATAIAPDPSHGIWVADTSDYSATHIDAAGNLIAAVDCCGPSDAVALDASANAWVANYLDDAADLSSDTDKGSISLIAPDGRILQQFLTGGGLLHPSGLAVDASGTVWVANYRVADGQTWASFSELAASSSSTPGAALSPATGFGLDAKLLEPYSIAVDPSGNLWLANQGRDSVIMFFGAAAPTKTPKTVTPVAP
ncbi:MAG TPA: hypothetical protein VM865_07600 [Acidobacteriaceae bacterium]|nr:hypothetical protein [Acidobacteriaceae bacterium]